MAVFENTLATFDNIYLVTLPKGIQHCVKTFKHQMAYSTLLPFNGITYLTTTVMFHIGGFWFFLNCAHRKLTLVFNHSPDFESNNTEELYKQIDKFQPFVLIFGSHDCVSMAKQR